VSMELSGSEYNTGDRILESVCPALK